MKRLIHGLSLAALLAAAQSEGAQQTVYKAAQSVPHVAGAPRHSDVIMRTLKLRTAAKQDERDTLKALDAFHVTRLEWAYLTDAGAIRKIQDSGRLFGGAISAPSYKPRPGDTDWFDNVVIKDRKGNPIIAPWKRAWSRTLWGCMNNPELERGYLEVLHQFIDLGAQVLQRDEPGGNRLAVNWGGCFCSHCMERFRDFLHRATTRSERESLGIPQDPSQFNYADHLAAKQAPVGDAFRRWDGGRLKELFEEFQMESTVAFHQRTREALDRYAGRHVPMSCNNGAHRWTDIESGFDWAFGELSFSHAHPDTLLDIFSTAARVGRPQVVTMPKSSQPEDLENPRHRIRPTIATAYALGGWCMVPWDVYMPGDTPRYFGEPRDYADLYGFIHGIEHFLDGYEQAAAGGVISFNSRLDPGPIVLPEGRKIAATVRAKPGKRGSPAVIHLVDWSESPKPFQLALRAEFFDPQKPVRARLLRPVPYQSEIHTRAQESGDFSGLVETIPLESGYRSSWTLPALDPWGVVIIEPDPDVSTKGVWEPVIELQGAESTPTTVALVTCATEGATIRYTLDGSEPASDSSVYRGPLEIEPPVAIKARAYAGNQASHSAFREIDKNAFSPPMVRNGEFSQGFSHWHIRQSAEAKMETAISEESPLDSGPVARIRILNTTGTAYHLRLLQEFTAEKRQTYTLRFTAWSDRPTRIRVGLQGKHAPHQVVAMRMIDLEPTARTFVVSGRQDADALPAYVQFDCGTAGEGRTIWIDQVQLFSRD